MRKKRLFKDNILICLVHVAAGITVLLLIGIIGYI